MNRVICLIASFLIAITSVYALAGKSKIRNVIRYSKTVLVDSMQKEKISLQAVAEIKYQAATVVQTLELILNSITFNENTTSELEAYIANSFAPNQRSRVFYNQNIIIEDDVNPKYTLNNSRDVTADKYLRDFDISYEKTADFSIKFYNIIVSEVKKTDHMYVRVKFETKFGSKYKNDNSTYQTREREAVVRVEPVGKKKWNAFIEAISFFNPTLPIESKDHNVAVLTYENSLLANNSTNSDDLSRNSNLLLSTDKNKKEQASINTTANNWDANRKIKQLDMALQTF